MAFPVILVNSATGSDSAASGAGPTPAITGSAAATSGDGLTVTLDAGTVLSGVATDGSHAIFLNDTTAGARNFGKITATAGSGGATPTVTVSNAFGLSLSGKSWAIGGKRASIGSTTSKKLFDNNSAAGDAMPGWIVECESGHTETIAAAYGMRRAGDQTDGPIILRGTSDAGTMPILTFSNNGNTLEFRGNYNQIRDIELRNTNATKTGSIAVSWITSTTGCRVRGVVVTHATNKFWKGMAGGSAKMFVENCDIANCASIGITLPANIGGVVKNCTIRACGSHGISLPGGGATVHYHIEKNRIYGNAGDGINRTNGASSGDCFTIVHNTIHSNAGDGIEIALAAGTALTANTIESNQITSNTGFGINLSGASMTTAAWLSTGSLITHNNVWNNTAGDCNITGVMENGQAVDPGYTDAANGDFRISTATRALGYPTANHLDFSYRSYFDIGSEQSQAAGGAPSISVARRFYE